MGGRKLEIKKHYIFDVDGTLTPSRRKINDDFAVFFSDFCANNLVYLVTGSDKEKTIEQIGEEIYSLCERVYNCSGCDVWEGEFNVRSKEWSLPEVARNWLRKEIQLSEFCLRTGNHIEERAGMVNFSTVGRNATLGERKLYVDFDTTTNERNRIAREFNLQFPAMEAKPGGETGIDISPVGWDKSQILVDFDPKDEIYFFGDRMDKDGNDYPLKREIIDKDLGICYNINNYNETWNILKHL